MAVTLKDIATVSGVSIKTVSNVINGKSAYYSEQTFEAVMKIARELGYIPNMAARSLRSGRAGIIAVVVPDIMNPYFSEITQLIIDQARTARYAVVVDFTSGLRDEEMMLVNSGRPFNADGIILYTSSLDVSDIEPRKVGVPMVLIGERLVDAPYDHVMIDNVRAARDATSHLISLGRRRIAAIGLTAGLSHDMTHLRRIGYRTAMGEAGLPIDPAYEIVFSPPRFDRHHGAFVMRELLNTKQPPDAVFCFNDLMALGALTVLTQAGRRVPDDVAVIGFDDIPECRYSPVPLSTLSPDKKEISRMAASSLIGQIEGGRSRQPELFQPSYSLIPRTSTIGEHYVSDTGAL